MSQIKYKKPLNFYSHTKKPESGPDLRALSNLFPFEMELSDAIKTMWPSTTEAPPFVNSIECAFQAMKPYKNSYCSIFLVGTPDKGYTNSISGITAAQFGQGRFKPSKTQQAMFQENKFTYETGKRPELVENGFEKWKEQSLYVMMELIRCKFTRDNEMGKILLQFQNEADDILFVEHTSNDNIWGDNSDGSGKNLLGKLLTFRLKELMENTKINLDEFQDYLNTPNKQFVDYTIQKQKQTK